MGAHLVDSCVYGHLWATPELRQLFDDNGRFQSWLEILAALAEAQAEVGLVPADAARAIRDHADVTLLNLDQVGFATRATGHSTLGLIRCLTEVLPPQAREWVYYGATVQDLSDTWTAVVAQRVGDVVERDLRRVEAATLALAREHRDVIMCGRTHGQPGLPITFGFKAAVWASELRRHRARLAEGRRRWEVVQLGGAPFDRLHCAVLAELGGGTCRIGVGGVCERPGDFPRSYREAQFALTMQVVAKGAAQVVDFDGLGVYRLLSGVQDTVDVERFVRSWLGTLLDYDSRKHSGLVDTLTEYLECGGSYDSAAQSLSVHRNTLKYRLQRIREISGHNLSCPDTRFNLQLATRAWQTLVGLRSAP